MKRASLLLAIGCLPFAVVAQTDVAAGGQGNPPALQMRHDGGISYLCGGIGAEEARYLRSEAKKHDLMLEFATRRGDYLADVNVEIADAKGKPLLQTSCDGPIMVIDLPQRGRYRITAESGGYPVERVVNVSRGRQSVASTMLTWPEQVAAGAPSTQTSSGASGEENSSDAKR